MADSFSARLGRASKKWLGGLVGILAGALIRLILGKIAESPRTQYLPQRDDYQSECKEMNQGLVDTHEEIQEIKSKWENVKGPRSELEVWRVSRAIQGKWGPRLTIERTMSVELHRVMNERLITPSTRSFVVVEVVLVLVKHVHVERNVVLIIEGEALPLSVAVFRSIVLGSAKDAQRHRRAA